MDLACKPATVSESAIFNLNRAELSQRSQNRRTFEQIS